MIRARKAALVGGALALGSALLFARTLVLATVIPTADFAKSAILAVMMSLIDLFVLTGVQVRAFQHPQADDDRILQTLHAAQALRGGLGAFGVLACAWPMASLVGMPDLATGFAAMAILPLVLGLIHLGPYRNMRNGRHNANACVTVIPALTSLAAIWPLALWLGDWRAFIGMQLVHAVAIVATSHLAVPGTWRPKFGPEIRDHFRFYVPLLATGAILIVALQGDRVLVARFFDEATLASFAIALTLTVPLVQIGIRTLSSLLQPQLAQAEGERLADRARVTFDLHNLAAAGLVAGAVLLGPGVIAMLFNADLQLAANLVAAVAAIQAIRLMRAGITSALVAKGDGVSDFLSNLPRLVALGVGLLVLEYGGSLQALLLVAGGGELACLLVAIRRLRGLIQVRPVLLASAWPLPLFAVTLVFPPHHLATLATLAAMPLLALLFSPHIRRVAGSLRPSVQPDARDAKPL